MQTEFRVNPRRGVEGQPVGERKSRPGHFAYDAQQTQIRIANSEAGNLGITVVDDDTEQEYSLTVAISGVVEATSLDEMLAAAEGNADFRRLFTFAEDGVEDLTMTARHANRSYTVTTTTPGSMTAVVSELQAAGGEGVEFGRMLARSSTGDRAVRALEATDEIGDLVGILFRTDGNHFHSLENDTPSAVDKSEPGRTYPVMQAGRVLVKVEEAVNEGDPVFVRRALTSGAGRLGGFRASAAGGQQSYTFTPSAINLPGYGFEFDYQGVHYTALYLGDGSTTVAQACDGLVQDLGSISGLTITDGGTEVTIQTAAGTQLENVRNLASHTDVPADSVTISEAVSEDVDTIDISSIADFEDSAPADGLATLRLKLAPL